MDQRISVALLRSEYQKLQAQIKQAKQSADEPLPTESAPSSRVSEVPPTASDTRDSELVTDKKDPDWQEWLKAERAARTAGIETDTSTVHIGIDRLSLRSNIETLQGLISEKTEPEAF